MKNTDVTNPNFGVKSMMLTTKTAISYQRFSSGEQAKGDSERRQNNGFLAFCQAHGLTPASTMVDRGLSGFHGHHKAKGEFGRFLAALQADTLPNPKSTVLVVEAWDRLSREAPDVALATVKEILATGVSIGIVSMDTIFTVDDLDSYKLFAIIGSMIEARQSSKLKAERTRANRQRLIASGMVTKFGKKAAACPQWISVNDAGVYEFNALAEPLKAAINLAINGHGASSIKAQVPGLPPGLTGIFRQITLIGLYQYKARTGKNSRKAQGEPKPIYPPLISEDTFRRLQMALDSRKNKRGAKGVYVTNLFTDLCTDVTTGKKMMVHKWRHEVLKARKGQNIKYALVEKALLSFLKEINVKDLFPQQAKPATEEIDNRLAFLTRRLNEMKNWLSNPDYSTDTVMSAIAGLEQEKAKLSQERETIKRNSANPVTDQFADTRSVIQAIGQAKGTDLLNMRTRLKSLIRGLIKEISVHVINCTRANIKIRFVQPLERWIKIEGESSKVTLEGDYQGFREFLGEQRTA